MESFQSTVSLTDVIHQDDGHNVFQLGEFGKPIGIISSEISNNGIIHFFLLTINAYILSASSPSHAAQIVKHVEKHLSSMLLPKAATMLIQSSLFGPIFDKCTCTAPQTQESQENELENPNKNKSSNQSGLYVVTTNQRVELMITIMASSSAVEKEFPNISGDGKFDLHKSSSKVLSSEGLVFTWSSPGLQISINESADPSVRIDLKTAFDRLTKGCPESKDVLVGNSLCMSTTFGGVDFGTWQGIHLTSSKNSGCDSCFSIISSIISSSMRISFNILTKARRCTDIQRFVETVISRVATELANKIKNMKVGLALIYVKHTSASLALLTETEAEDFERVVSEIVPESWNSDFIHTYEGCDDMPGHVKSTLVGCHIVLPIMDGHIIWGTNELDTSLWLVEHRDGGGSSRKSGRYRNLTVTVAGTS